MLRYDQQHSGEPVFGVDLHGPDWCALGSAFGLRAERTDQPGLAAMLSAHLADPRPSMVVLDARLLPPPTTSPRWYRAE
jgi:acetolactate synthase-1/2/3 large subunit